MPSVYAGADVFVLPSVSEPFGNVVLEAMASQKPVIGSYVGGMKDTIVDDVTGYHVQVGSVKQLSELVLRTLQDRALKIRMGKNARKRATGHFGKDAVIKKIINICEKGLIGIWQYDCIVV
jgi:glycosyltransferase involved in cell wall biosynthesis